MAWTAVQTDKAVTGCCIVRDWQVVERHSAICSADATDRNYQLVQLSDAD